MAIPDSRSRVEGFAWRVWEEFNKDRMLLVAAGATFYLLLALFPALAAFMSLYGFVADPVTVADHVSYLAGLLPSTGLDLIRQQLQALGTSEHKRPRRRIFCRPLYCAVERQQRHQSAFRRHEHRLRRD